LQENKIPIFEREGWQSQPSLSKIGILLIRRSLTPQSRGAGEARRGTLEAGILCHPQRVWVGKWTAVQRNGCRPDGLSPSRAQSAPGSSTPSPLMVPPCLTLPVPSGGSGGTGRGSGTVDGGILQSLIARLSEAVPLATHFSNVEQREGVRVLHAPPFQSKMSQKE